MFNPVKMRDSLRNALQSVYIGSLRNIWGMHIGEGCKISFKALLDKSNPKGIHIGNYTGIAFGGVVLAHNFLKNEHVDTFIGARCHIGANAIIYPGIVIGDGCIVSAGSVVTRDVPEGCLVAGNPARVVEKDIKTGKWGVRIDTIPADRLDPNVVTIEESEL